MENRFLTTGELATELRTPTATLRYWRHKGVGPRSLKVGRRVLYAESEVAAWLAQLATQETGRA
jgi:predicted DNA-binding transcriptional regulator AlpA